MTLLGPKLNTMDSCHLSLILGGVPVKVAHSRHFSLSWLWNPSWKQSVPIQISEVSIYAGLYQANFPPLLKKLCDMLSSWFHLPLSWLGRITAVRMSYLPKRLHFFSVLPIQVPSHILQIYQRKLLHFIWGSTHPPISKQILYAKRIN